jgi:hypothetical protein
MPDVPVSFYLLNNTDIKQTTENIKKYYIHSGKHSVDEFIDPDWGDKVNFGIGLS